MFSLLQFCSSAFCGLVSDRYGRKPTLIISMVRYSKWTIHESRMLIFVSFLQIGISISYLIWCFSYSLTVFMIARTVSGLVKANLAITMAIISDVTSEAQRNRAMVYRKTWFSTIWTENRKILFSFIEGLDRCCIFFGFYSRSDDRCFSQSNRREIVAKFER